MNILESTKLAVAMCSLLFCTTVLGVFGLMMAWEHLLEGVMRLRRLPPRWVQQLLVWASWPLPDSVWILKAAYFTVKNSTTCRVGIRFGIGANVDPLESVYFLDPSGHWWTRDACSRHFTRAAAERAAAAALLGGDP